MKNWLFQFGKGQTLALQTGLILLGLLAWTQTWATSSVIAANNSKVSVSISGAEASAGYLALGIAALASIGVIAIAGRKVRFTISFLLVLFCVGMVAASVVWLSSPAQSFIEPISKLTGLIGPDQSGLGERGISITFWAYLALFVAVGASLMGVLVTLIGLHWPDSDGKFESNGGRNSKIQGDQPNWVTDWDQLALGNDPTDKDSKR